MFLVGTFIFLTLVTSIHMVRHFKNKSELEIQLESVSLVKWASLAIILGFSVGSLSLSTFEPSQWPEKAIESLLLLKNMVFVLVVLILIRSLKKMLGQKC